MSGSLASDDLLRRKLELNLRRNRSQSQGEGLESLAAEFRYEDHAAAWWNPEKYSLLWGTPLWDQSSPSQRLVLNHLFWVAYYSQIVSAEIATIFFNQAAAAGLYTLEDYRVVCDTLDLETIQERSHVAGFRRVAEATEQALFGEALFTYPMRSLYVETMVFHNARRVETFWKNLQFRAFVALSSSNAFLASQYLTVRGLRTLNGKLIQHQLSEWQQKLPDAANAAIPARISHLHFLDESFHFNTSTIVGTELFETLPPPTAFERFAVNKGIRGCQFDHFNFSVVLNGIFWYDPATFATVYRVLRSKSFGLDDRGAREMLARCFGEECEGVHESFRTHRVACESYKAYLAPLGFVSAANREMRIMASNSVARHLAANRRALARFQGA
jgi:hypothetical protein